MRISDLRSDGSATRPRVAATVTWEERERPPLDLYFETDERFAADLSCDPHGFLVACVPPALRHGERRIAIDEDICPELHDGLQTAMQLLQHGSGRTAPPLCIEARSTTRASAKRAEARAGAFLSGGVDSLTTLRLNRLAYAPDHPRSIADCLFVQGFDIDVDDTAGFELALSSLAEVVRDTGLTLVPVRSNVRDLERDTAFWMRESHASALAGVAHAFSNRFRSVTIASTFNLKRLPTLYGSHPLLDPCYGSSALRVLHDGIRYTRLDKVRIVAGWDVGLQNLRVCTRRNHPGLLNCGRCEKCTRTMLELMVLGKLEQCPAFEANDVELSAISRITVMSPAHAFTLEDVIEPLRTVGRADLADAVDRKVRSYRAWNSGRGWRGAIARLDRRGSSGVVRSIKAVDGTRDWGKAARRIVGAREPRGSI
ncbi:MAG: hypothetical protein ACRDH7_04805 [Actinomycetota bacterium]